MPVAGDSAGLVPDAAKAPRRVPSRERVGRRIPNTAKRNRLAGTGSETSRSSRFCLDCQSGGPKNSVGRTALFEPISKRPGGGNLFLDGTECPSGSSRTTVRRSSRHRSTASDGADGGGSSCGASLGAVQGEPSIRGLRVAGIRSDTRRGRFWELSAAGAPSQIRFPAERGQGPGPVSDRSR